MCSTNGTCDDIDTCTCDADWEGDFCEITRCNGIISTSGNVCSNMGTCTAPDTCVCRAGVTGQNCEIPICIPACVNGECTAPDTCDCAPGWEGDFCEIPICTSGCVNGECTAPDFCTCDTGWEGSDCSIPICFGVPANDPTVCPGNGICTEPDTCTCASDAECDDGLCGTDDSCNGGTGQCEFVPNADDADGDGVCVDVDLCPDTVVPEANVPSRRLGINRWALVDDDSIFDTTASRGRGPRRSYSTEDTGGCSCEQIIEILGLGKGHLKYGCSIGAMDTWVEFASKDP